MTFPDTQPRRLSYSLRGTDTLNSTTPDEQIVNTVADIFPPDPDTRAVIGLDISLNEYVALATAIDVGRDIAFPDDSIRLWHLWVRALTEADGLPVEQLATCFRMDTTTEAFSFHPNDPFTDPRNENSPSVATFLHWRRWVDIDINSLPVAGNLIESVLGFATGYFPNDVFLVADDIPFFENAYNLLADYFSLQQGFGLPYVLIELEGTGQLEVELINVPLGGVCILIPDLELSLSALVDYIVDVIDNDGIAPPSWIFAEVNRDITAIPPELAATQVQEFEFTTEGTHTLHAVFIPQINDEIPFLFPFGGIREIEACGTLSILGAQTGESITKQNFGNGQHIREGVIPVSTISDICEGVLCALETVSSRILLADDGNVKDAISIGADGGKTIDTSKGLVGGTTGLTSTAKQLRNGVSVALLVGLKKWLLDLQTYHDNNIGDIATATAYMRGKYDLFDTFDTKYQNYYNYRLVPNGQLPPFLDILESLLYCGANSLADVKTWIIDSYTGDKVLLLSLVETISSIQWTIWSMNNIKPIDDYLSYACTLRPPYELRLTTAKWLDNSIFINALSPAWTINQTERFARVEIEGSIGIDSLNYHDGLYKWVDGIPTYDPILIGGYSNYSGSFVAWGAKALNPFDSLRDYTIQLPVTGTFTSWNTAGVKRPTALPSWSDGTETGQFTITVTDLGAIG